MEIITVQVKCVMTPQQKRSVRNALNVSFYAVELTSPDIGTSSAIKAAWSLAEPWAPIPSRSMKESTRSHCPLLAKMKSTLQPPSYELPLSWPIASVNVTGESPSSPFKYLMASNSAAIQNWFVSPTKMVGGGDEYFSRSAWMASA